ncbi:MAG: type II toxin-antitoxin system VapC family toxin [Chloroflexi bacterium]|nr:type II toxin-antitoxin system VapC family toxin [Chloroflexota bacterium]
MTVVVDASLALKWVVPAEDSEIAQRLRVRWQEAGQSLIGPPIFRPEITNALYQMVRRATIRAGEADEALSALLPVVRIHEPEQLYRRALTIAVELGIGATYDALYVALAEAEGCDLWTADRRLVRAAQPSCPQVRWIGEPTG